MVDRPMWAKAIGLGIVGGLLGLAFTSSLNKRYGASTDPAPQPSFSLSEWPDLTPPPYWSRPLYSDTSAVAANTFLNAPSRKPTAQDTSLPYDSHMERYDVRYDRQQQAMINANLREQFGRWR
jgi:hypothetical protein